MIEARHDIIIVRIDDANRTFIPDDEPGYRTVKGKIISMGPFAESDAEDMYFDFPDANDTSEPWKEKAPNAGLEKIKELSKRNAIYVGDTVYFPVKYAFLLEQKPAKLYAVRLPQILAVIKD